MIRNLFVWSLVAFLFVAATVGGSVVAPKYGVDIQSIHHFEVNQVGAEKGYIFDIGKLGYIATFLVAGIVIGKIPLFARKKNDGSCPNC